MPFFEVSLITRSLSKVRSLLSPSPLPFRTDLVKALCRAGNVLLDQGGVIEKVESLGHRDLPFKRITKQTGDPVYSSNFFIFHTHLSIDAKKQALSTLTHDLDTVHVSVVAVPEEAPPPIKCNIEEMMLPPSKRDTVTTLREGQKMGHFTRQIIYKRTEKEWKTIPKSYPIAPPRP